MKGKKLCWDGEKRGWWDDGLTRERLRLQHLVCISLVKFSSPPHPFFSHSLCSVDICKNFKTWILFWLLLEMREAEDGGTKILWLRLRLQHILSFWLLLRMREEGMVGRWFDDRDTTTTTSCLSLSSNFPPPSLLLSFSLCRHLWKLFNKPRCKHLRAWTRKSRTFWAGAKLSSGRRLRGNLRRPLQQVDLQNGKKRDIIQPAHPRIKIFV